MEDSGDQYFSQSIKTFKTTQAISPKQQTWANHTIPLGTLLQQVPDTKNRINPIQGIVVDYENESIAIPYSFLEPTYPYKTTILLLHGFNSAPGNKESIIKTWLTAKGLDQTIEVVAPQLPYSPNEAVKLIGKLIQEHYGNLVVIGTSLGGFYANYVRAVSASNAIKVHAINPTLLPKRQFNCGLSFFLLPKPSFLSFTSIDASLSKSSLGDSP